MFIHPSAVRDEVIEPKVFQKFKDTYFHLLPTWLFMKIYAREALRQQLRL
jgi:hypothetical protein